jgi:hypothetical protein
VNLKGVLPEGYTDGKAQTVNGVGAVTSTDINKLNDEELKQLRTLSQDIAAFWSALEATKDADRRADMIERYSRDATKSANVLFSLYAQHGLQGPYYQ